MRLVIIFVCWQAPLVLYRLCGGRTLTIICRIVACLLLLLGCFCALGPRFGLARALCRHAWRIPFVLVHSKLILPALFSKYRSTSCQHCLDFVYVSLFEHKTTKYYENNDYENTYYENTNMEIFFADMLLVLIQHFLIHVFESCVVMNNQVGMLNP